MVSRRDCLRMAAAGVSFYLSLGLVRLAGGGDAKTSGAQTLLHPALDARWPESARYLGSQTGTRQRRPLQGDPNVGPRSDDQRTSARLGQADEPAAVIRSMSTKEGDHNRATSLMQTGYLPQGPIRYPCFGSLFSKELVDPHSEMPGFVSIAPATFFRTGPGFLGPQYAPMIVGGGPVAPAKPEKPDADAPKRSLRTILVRRSRSPTWGGRRASPRGKPRRGSTSSSNSTGNSRRADRLRRLPAICRPTNGPCS